MDDRSYLEAKHAGSLRKALGYPPSSTKPGDIVTLQSGTAYEVQDDGSWRRVDDRAIAARASRKRST